MQERVVNDILFDSARACLYVCMCVCVRMCVCTSDCAVRVIIIRLYPMRVRLCERAICMDESLPPGCKIVFFITATRCARKNRY